MSPWVVLLVASLGQTPAERGTCRVEQSFARAQFEIAFAEMLAEPVVVVADLTLAPRAATMWGAGRWWVHYNPSSLCPLPDEKGWSGVGPFVAHVARHEACHALRHGAYLRGPRRDLAKGERMRMELEAEDCASERRR